jgi:type IV pilus biogenesis protein PilP
LWLARDLPVRRWLGLGADLPPMAAQRAPAQPAAAPPTPAPTPVTQPPANTAPSFAPPQQSLPAIAPPAAPTPQTAAVEPPPVGTDPARATLIDQIGALQMQLVLARLKRELAQAQAETSKFAADTGEPAGVEALLDRMAERDGARSVRGLAVQAVFGRDGDWAARLLLPGEGSRLVRKGDVLADRWRVDSIDERAVVLVALHGDARQVLRPGAGAPRATDFEGDEPAPPRPAPKPASAGAPAAAADAAIAQAPVAGSMLRGR